MENITRAELLEALKESVKLQSHYAELLNMYDGGERIIFNNADNWIKRLEYLKKQKKRDWIEAKIKYIT